MAVVASSGTSQTSRGFFKQIVQAAALGDRSRNRRSVRSAIHQRRITPFRQVCTEHRLVEGNGLLFAQKKDLPIIEGKFDMAVRPGDNDLAFHDDIADLQRALATVLRASECLTLKKRDLANSVCHDEYSRRNSGSRTLCRRSGNAYWTEVQDRRGRG